MTTEREIRAASIHQGIDPDAAVARLLSIEGFKFDPPPTVDKADAIARIADAVESGELVLSKFKPGPWAYVGVDLSDDPSDDMTCVTTYKVGDGGKLEIVKIEQS